MRGLIIAAIIALILGGLWWWHNRSIKPVQLSAEEKAVVAEKVEAIQKPAEPSYQKGGKEIILTSHHSHLTKCHLKKP